MPAFCPTQVYNLTTYPHLVGLLETLGVDSEESEMSFALSIDRGALEWASHGLGTIFAQRENLWKPSFWRMIYDVVRFSQQAPKVVSFPRPFACLVQAVLFSAQIVCKLSCHSVSVKPGVEGSRNVMQSKTPI